MRVAPMRSMLGWSTIAFAFATIVLAMVWIASLWFVAGYQREGQGFWFGWGGVAVGTVSSEREPEFAAPGWFFKRAIGPARFNFASGGYFRSGVWFFFPLVDGVAIATILCGSHGVLWFVSMRLNTEIGGDARAAGMSKLTDGPAT